jgi:hypothetical protein
MTNTDVGNVPQWANPMIEYVAPCMNNFCFQSSHRFASFAQLKSFCLFFGGRSEGSFFRLMKKDEHSTPEY